MDGWWAVGGGRCVLHFAIYTLRFPANANENILPTFCLKHPHTFTSSSRYMQCVSEHMKELKPFGDVPDKLSVQIKRSFVATRTYGQALITAAEVSKKILQVSECCLN